MSSGRGKFSPFAYLRAVVDRSTLTPAAKLAGLALLRFADTDGQARPLQSTVAERAGASVATIRRAVRELEAAGLVSTSYTKGAGLRTRLAEYALKAPLTGERTLTPKAPLTFERSPKKAPLTSAQRHRSPMSDRTALRELPKQQAAPQPSREALAQDSPRERIWTLGVTILTAAGRTESAARALLGRWIKDHGEEAVAGALGAAATRADPAAYLGGTLRRQAKRHANGAELLLTPDEERTARRRPQ
jgi:hypothetical protein